MTEQSYWITTANGYFAQVDGVDERDKWTPLGWRLAKEPGPTDFVYLRKDDIANPGLFAYQAVPVWQELGWKYGTPPEPVDLTKDPAVVEPEPEPEPEPQKKTKAKPAAGAAENSEE